MKTLAITLAGTVWCPLIFGQVGWGAFSPQDSTGLIEGNSSLVRPFANPSSRFQQLYSTGDFPTISANTGIGYVERIYFRVDATNGSSFSGIANNLEIRLSTTSGGPDSLSPIFSQNIGLNETIVFGPADKFVMGQLNFGEFNVRIDFTTPFLYRPADGNLLVDFRVSGGAAGILDAWDRVGDSVGSVYGNRDDLFGTATTIGLATHFEGTLAVPEPSTYALLITGLAALGMFRARRPRRN